jgi:hypothetical protein
LGADIATDGSGNPIYGAGGEIGYTDGTLVEELAVSFVKGDNSFIIANIADDYGNTTSTYPFEATRIPALRYDGLTTVDEETYGTTYDGALSLIVDEGLAEETTATPEEAPYTFTSGDYRVYNFTASYTYPATTASNSVPVVITYKEFAVEPLDSPKAWTYYDDEWVLNKQPTANIFDNTNPTGGLVLNSRLASPTIATDTSYLYANHGLIPERTTRHGAEFGTVLDVDLFQAPYVTGVNSDKLFKAEETWSIEFWVKGFAVYFAFGSGNNVLGNVTGLAITANDINMWIGGVSGTTIPFVGADWNHFVINNYHNGTAWAGDLILNGEAKYTNKTTERGTGSYDTPPVIGGRWNVSDVIDPDTDAQVSTGGTFGYVRAGLNPLTEAQASALYYRNRKYYATVCLGDSNASGTGSGFAWPKQLSDYDEEFYMKTQICDVSFSGQNIYEALPATPATGFSTKAPWVTGGRPSPSVYQDAEIIMNTIIPEAVAGGFTQNGVKANQVDKNPNGGLVGGEAGIGWNTYADETVWANEAIKAYYAENGVTRYIWSPCCAVDDASGSIGSDLLSIQDALRAVDDAVLANYTGDDVYHVHEWSRVSNVNNSLDPAYDFGDGAHYNTPWHNKVSTENMIPFFVNYALPTRDKFFDPTVIITDPVDGAVYFMNPLPVQYFVDGIEFNDTSTFPDGINTVYRESTNTFGRVGSDSIDVEKKADTYPDDLADMKYDATLASSYTEFDSGTTVDNWQNSGVLSGTREFVSDVDRLDIVLNASGERAFQGGTSDQNIVYTETGGETYKGTEWSMSFTTIMDNNGALKYVLDRRNGTFPTYTDGFRVSTNEVSGDKVMRVGWVDNGTGSFFETDFGPFANGDLVTVWMVVKNTNELDVYCSNGQSDTGRFTKTMTTNQPIGISGDVGGFNYSAQLVEQLNFYSREITATERPLFENYYQNKFLP